MTLRTTSQEEYRKRVVAVTSFALIEFLHRINLTRDISQYSFYSICATFSDEEIECFEYTER